MRPTTIWILLVLVGAAGCVQRSSRAGGGGGGEGEGEGPAEGEGEGGGPCSCAGDEDCDDGDPCNGSETCGACWCEDGTPPDCTDDHECTDDRCGPAGCVHLPVHARCDPGEICLPGSGGCVTAPACRDDDDCSTEDPCLDSRCDPVTRTCLPEAFDGDGDGSPPLVCGGEDCDDSTDAVGPGQPELCNERDDDCDGDVDEDCVGGSEGEGEGEGAPDAPRIAVEPENVVFHSVDPGLQLLQELRIRNEGGGVLTVSSIELYNDASGSFSVEIAANSPQPSLPAALRADDPGDLLRLGVFYQPDRAGETMAELRIRSDDEARPEVRVRLRAVSELPCVEVRPLDLDFGPVPIDQAEDVHVEVSNCGTTEVVVTSLRLVEGTSGDFRLAGPLDGLDDGCLRERDGACEGRAVLPVGATGSFTVRYAPSDEGADGGRVALETSVPGAEELEVNLFGRGRAAGAAPTCLAEARLSGGQRWDTYADEGDRLVTIPLKTLELRGTGSRAEGGIRSYEWTVLRRPEDSVAQIEPHAADPDPRFFLDLAGRYVFELEVRDNAGERTRCEVHAETIPDEDLHLQLVWHTPADPDETDTGFGAGSDVDLHLLHPLGEWLCSPRDVFYANPNPDWGVAFDPSDDPSLDIDDTDGAGPENINLNHPEDDRTYTVGVHYFNDHGYGAAFATVRIYVEGEKRFELANERLPGTDAFWQVAEIAWPSGDITPIDVQLPAPPPADCD